MFDYDLEIRRGARFPAHAWQLVNEHGEPIVDQSGVSSVVAKIRRYRGDTSVLHTFSTQIVMLALPDRFDGAPVVAAQIDKIEPAGTAALSFDRGVWDIVVDGDVLGGGLVSAPLVVSR
ncbi:hypothetical protein [uncultured Deinococcus sp.]|uniref:hypothetical protein n=1 Tax=uncultured Deinococcus sp. TaxID=158789 RepID=UPI0025D7FC42|nr:hypothetical protein [uncultured Deinococcus sp.]